MEQLIRPLSPEDIVHKFSDFDRAPFFEQLFNDVLPRGEGPCPCIDKEDQ